MVVPNKHAFLSTRSCLLGAGMVLLAVFFTYTFGAGTFGPNMWRCTAHGATLTLEADRSAYELGPRVEILEDPGLKLSLEDLLTPEERGFAPNPEKTIEIGRTESAVWLRFKLAPPDRPETRHNWFLEVGKQGIGSLDLYIPLSGREGHYKKIEFGTWRSYPPDHIPSRTSVVALPESWDSQGWFFLRIKSDISINFPLRIYRAGAFIQHLLPDLYGFGILFGILIGMILYNLSIFLFLRERIYLFYVLYIFSMFWYMLILYGHFEALFKPSPDQMRAVFFTGSGMVWVFGGLFSRSFLNTRRLAPVLDRLIIVMILVSTLITFTGLAGLNFTAHRLNIFVGVTGPPLAMMAAVRAWQKRFAPARYFLAAWLIMMTGIMLYSMGGIFIPRSPVTIYTFAVGAGIESVLLSLALADRIRLLQVEKERLTHRAQQLRRDAETDSLTGLFNRRFLLATLEAEIIEAGTRKKPLSLLILDVDHFKRFNDAYGHLEGDRVLVSLANVLFDHLREKDSPCRYGGEEFVVVLPNTGLPHALAAAERIRTAFSELVFDPESGEKIGVTVSIGAAELHPRDGAQDLIRRADNALYQAKNSGRNRVVAA